MGYEVGTIIEAKVLYVTNNQKCMNVFHYSPDALGAGVDPIPLVDDFLAQFAALVAGEVIPSLAGLMSKFTTITRATAQIIHPKRYIVRHQDILIPGTTDGACSRQNSAVTITKTGILGKRSNVGACHVGGVADQYFDHGVITGAGLGLAGTLANAIKASVLGTLGGVNYSPCILNKVKIEGSNPIRFKISGYSLINDTQVQTTARTMRGRTVGHGQ